MGVEPCLQVYVVESVMMLTRCLLRLKKRECRDEMQKRGAKWQVRRERFSMGSGLGAFNPGSSPVGIYGSINVKIVLQHYAGARSLYIQEGRQDKGRKTAPRAGTRGLSHVRTPPPVHHVRTPPPVRHVRTPPPVRHLRTPIILTLANFRSLTQAVVYGYE